LLFFALLDLRTLIFNLLRSTLFRGLVTLETTAGQHPSRTFNVSKLGRVQTAHNGTYTDARSHKRQDRHRPTYYNLCRFIRVHTT